MEVSRFKKKKIGLNTSTKWAKHTHFKKPWFGSDFPHTREKKVDCAGLDEASLELGVSSEGFVKTREGGGISLHTLEDGGEG